MAVVAGGAAVAGAGVGVVAVAPPVIPHGSPLHGGAVTYADQALLGQVLSALDSAPHMHGAIVTIVAVCGFVGRVRPPAAAGQVYETEGTME